MAVKIYGSNRIDLDGNNETFSIRATADDELNFYKGANTKLMGMDASGFESKPNLPKFWAYRSGNGNDYSTTNLSCDVAEVNIGGHYNTSNFQFTAPVDGIYFFTVHAMNDQSNNGYSTVYFRKNGTIYHYFHIVNNHPSSATTNVIITLIAGDYVDVISSNTHWNGGSSNKYPTFGGYLIG